jgi:hypothetical protein
MRKSKNDWNQHRHQHVDLQDARSVGEFISQIVHGEGRLQDVEARNGHLGILIMVANMMHGTETVGHACRHLRIPADDLIIPFNNLTANGLLGDKAWPSRNKQKLMSMYNESADREALMDWCQIAATASGYLGMPVQTQGI